MSELTHTDFAAPEAALAQREADPAWTQKLLSGDAAARAEFKALSRAAAGLPREGVPVSAAAADLGPTDLFAEDARAKLPEFSVVTGDEISDHRKLDLIEQMRARGMNEVMIRESFDDNRSYSPELHEWARQRWHELSNDADFRRRLLSGDAVAERQWRAWCIIEAAKG